MFKKTMHVVLALCMILTMLSVSVGAWNVPEQVEDFYEISNMDELYWFAAQVNGGNTSINGKLIADIVVNENLLNADGQLNEGDFIIWAPIGFCVPGAAQRLYTGTFDGNGKTISGLYFEYGAAENLGLFGCIGVGGTVKNVTLTDCYFKGGRFVGGVAGANGGTISGCTVNATIISEEDAAGGITGVNFGSVERCASAGCVTGGNDAGGTVGTNSGTVSNCLNSASVASRDFSAGGISGYNTGMVINCCNVGQLLEGSTQGGITGGNHGTVENSYYLKDTAPASAEGLPQTAEEFASGQVCWLLQSEQEDQIWGQKLGRDSHPTLGGSKVLANTDGEGNVTGYENEPVPGVLLSGSVTSYLEDGDVTVELLLDGQVVSTSLVTEAYSFEAVAEGVYTLRISKVNHITREYEVTVADQDVTCDVVICPMGDVTGDGSVNIKDFQRLLRHVNKTIPLEGYALNCGDVTGDGTCNIKDFQRLLRHVNKTNPLF